MKRRSLIQVVFSVVMVWSLIVLALGCAAPTPPKEKGEVVDVLAREPIGVVRTFSINDLTGPSASTCVPHNNGLNDCYADLNAAGGLIYDDPKTGRQERVIIKFEWGDNKGQAGAVPTLYERMATATPKPVLCYMGSTAAAETLLPWTERDHIVEFSGMATIPLWYPPRWNFTGTPDYAGMACTAAWWAMNDWKAKGKTGNPGWAWFTFDSTYGRAPIKPQSEDYIRGLGFNIVGLWAMATSPVDYSGELTAMKRAGADYFYGNFNTPHSAVIMRNLSGLNLKGELVPTVCPYAIHADIVDRAGADAEGLVGVHYGALTTEMDRPGVKATYERAVRHDRKYNADYLLSGMLSRIMTDPIKLALETNGYPITGDDVFKAMISPNGWESGGITPKITWTETERRGMRTTYMRGVKDGKIVRVSEEFSVPDMSPRE